MSETLELLEDLLGEGLYKIGDKFIDVPKSVVGGSPADLKSYLASGSYKVYNDREDLISNKSTSLPANSTSRYNQIIEIFKGINNDVAREKGLAVILDDDNIKDISNYLTGSVALPSDMQEPTSWPKGDWVKELYYAADLSRDGAIGAGELLSCVVFKDMRMAEGGTSNTAAVDIANDAGSLSWSVKSGDLSAGRDTYKVNGKIDKFKEVLAASLTNENVDFPFGEKVMALMNGQVSLSKESVLAAIYADAKTSDVSISHLKPEGLARLNEIAAKFYALADASVRAFSAGHSYLFVSKDNYLAVGPNNENLKFRGTTQDKVSISADPGEKDREKYSMSFTSPEWAGAAPGFKGDKSLRKVTNSVNEGTKAFKDAWEALKGMRMDPSQMGNWIEINTCSKNLADKAEKLIKSIEEWKGKASDDASITGSNPDWFKPSPEYTSLDEINNVLKEIRGMPNKKPADKVAIVTKLSQFKSGNTKKIESILSSAGASGMYWFMDSPPPEAGRETAGRSRPGPRLMETLSLLEDLLTP